MQTQPKAKQEPELYAVFLKSRKHNHIVVVDESLTREVAIKHTIGLKSKGLPAYCCETSVLVERGILNR